MKKLLLLTVLFFSMINPSLAYLPQRVFEQQLDDCKIKALASVEAVKEEVEHINSMQIVTKKVSFKRKKRLAFWTPRKFSGSAIFYRVQNSDGANEDRGTIAYTPEVGDKALVFVDKKDGSIVNYVPVSDDIYEEIKKHGLKNVKVTVYDVTLKD